MGLFALLASIVVAGTFLVAGIAKVRDRAGTENAIVAFGLPGRLSGVVARLLPPIEIAVGLLTLVPATRRLGATAALVLLAMFVVVIAQALLRGHRPDCHCFGQVRSTPVGARTIVRNVVLAVLAGVVTWGGSRPIGDVNGGATILVAVAVLLTIAVAAQGWMLLGLLRRYGQVLLRVEALEHASSGGSAPGGMPMPGTGAVLAPPQPEMAWGGLPVGAPVPDVALETVDGGSVRIRELAARTGRAMLVFTDPGCGPCRSLMPDVAEWQRRHADRVVVAVVSAGTRGDVDLDARELGLDRVLLDPDRRAAEAFRYLGTPGAVVIDASGAVASRLAGGAPAIRQLLEETIGGRRQIPVRAEPAPGHVHSAQAPTLQVGDTAPAFELPDLDGRAVSLASHAGHDVLLLFWSPGCGFCQRMADDLRRWEETAGDDAPTLLVVAAGHADANRAFGFRAPVLLDADQAVTRAYAVSGTPIGVLVDAAGRIGSAQAPGADAVFRLLRVVAAA